MKIHPASERQNLIPIELRKTSMKFSLLNPDKWLLRDIIARVVAVLNIKYSPSAAQVTGIEAFSSSPLKGREGRLFNQPCFEKFSLINPRFFLLFKNCTKTHIFTIDWWGIVIWLIHVSVHTYILSNLAKTLKIRNWSKETTFRFPWR